MSDIKNIITKLIIIFILIFPVSINAQILKDTFSQNLVKETVDNIYNLQLEEAGAGIRALNLTYPGHPVIYLLEGLITYWENYPLIPSSPACKTFENNLRRCIYLCEKKTIQSDEAEYLLANLSARGMLLLFYSDNNLTKDVIPLAASTYQYIRKSFAFTATYSDFFFFTGLYNYSREVYPEVYPVYKPLAFLFPKGDKSKGLTELRISAKNSILFKAEAYSFLSGISSGIENDYIQALNYSESLLELYPSNLQYYSLYLKNLLLSKRYEEAEIISKSAFSHINNPYYLAQLSIFNGLLQEKKYHNDILAKQFYTEGVRMISVFGEYGNEFAAYGYFGLSRISERNGDHNNKKIMKNKALELAEFKNIDFDE